MGRWKEMMMRITCGDDNFRDGLYHHLLYFCSTSSSRHLRSPLSSSGLTFGFLDLANLLVSWVSSFVYIPTPGLYTVSYPAISR